MPAGPSTRSGLAAGGTASAFCDAGENAGAGAVTGGLGISSAAEADKSATGGAAADGGSIFGA